MWLIHDVVVMDEKGTAVQHAWYAHLLKCIYITRITIFHDPVPSRWRGTGSYIYADNHSFEWGHTCTIKTVFSFSSMGHFCSSIRHSEWVRHSQLLPKSSKQLLSWQGLTKFELIARIHQHSTYTFCMKLLQLTHCRSPMHRHQSVRSIPKPFQC